MNIKLVFALLIIALSSCSLQKRLYTKGFYSSKNASAKNQIKEDTINILAGSLKPIPSKEKNRKNDLFAEKSANKTPVFIDATYKLTIGCDTIVLRSGARITANISEINPTHIKFKNCGVTNEPDIYINKDDINYIILANGTKEVFEPKKSYAQPNEIQSTTNSSPSPYTQKPYRYEREKKIKSIDKKQTNPYAVTGFIFSLSTYPFALIIGFFTLFLSGLANLFGGSIWPSGVALGTVIPIYWFLIPFIFSFIGLICSITAVYQISQNKENQKGLAIAIVGVVLSALMMILVLALYFIAF